MNRMKGGLTMFYKLARIFFRIYFTLYHRVSIRGLDELECFLSEHGNASLVLAANHESYLDPPLVGMSFPGGLRFVAWDGLFRFKPFGMLIGALGAVPVDQQNKSSAAALLRHVIGFIEEGYSVLIFPEGGRTPDGNLQPLEGGTSLVALKTGAPIVPIWIEGTYRAYSIHMRFPRPRKVSIIFGEPIRVEDLPPEMTERERRGELTARLLVALEKMRDAVRGRG